MKKIILFITFAFSICISFSQIAIDEALPEYEVKDDQVTVEKFETQEVVTTITLDEISEKIIKYQSDITSNLNQIAYFQNLITKLEIEYAYLKSLGVLTSEEKEGERN